MNGQMANEENVRKDYYNRNFKFNSVAMCSKRKSECAPKYNICAPR